MKLIIVMCASLVLIGCDTTPVIKTEIVTINKPIPFIPKPPTVPTIEYQVDQLTFNDFANPGKVGQAYVYDMTFLRKRIEIDDMIFEQYRSGSAQFEEIEKHIQELYSGVESRIPPDPKTFVDPK